MGEFLMHWIENKLGLNLPFFQDPQKFRRSMSNGYLIGEILRKYNVISDDQCISLKKTLNNKCSVKNMQYIHRWLRDNGLSTDFQELLAIVEEEPGAAVRFIYRLYLWLESPKGFTIAGFKPMPNMHKYLRNTALAEEDECRGCNKLKPLKIEFKSWESLADRNKQAMEAGDGVQFASETKQHIYYDIPLQPPVLLNVKPFGGQAAESTDTEDLYYDYHSKPKSLEPETGNQEIEWMKTIPRPLTICSFRSPPDASKRKQAASVERNKVEEIDNSMKEMKKFNEVVQHSLDQQPINVKVYENGIGDPEDYKKSLLEMKRKLLDEQKLAGERENYRKSLTCKIQTAMIQESKSKSEEEIQSKISALPSRENNLAEFISSIHDNKQCFMDHKVFDENQLAEYRSMELLKEMSLSDQKEILRHCLAQKDVEFKACVDSETARAQQAALSNKVTTDVSGILDNLLDMVIKIATFRETAKTEPPNALLEEWKEEFHRADALQEAKESSNGEAVMTTLDDLRVNDYLFREAGWDVEVPGAGEGVENHVLKKIVSYVLEGLYPAPIPDPTLPPPQFAGAVIVTGVNFHWRPSKVRESLLDISEPNSLHILDATLMVQEAVKAYAAALAMATNSPLLNGNFGMYSSIPGEVEGEDFQTLWTRSLKDPQGNALENADNEEEETDGSEGLEHPESVVTFGQNKEFQEEAQSTERPSRAVPQEGQPERKSSKSSLSKDGKKQAQKKLGKNSKVLHDQDISVDYERTGDETLSPISQLPLDGREITEKTLERAFKKKIGRRSIQKSKDSQYYTEPPEYSKVYEIVRDSLRQMSMTDAATEDDLQILFSPQDQPESWPEFVKLGKLAWDQLLTGYPVSDSLVARIVTERMRHYPAESYVVILNYPQALCQAIYLEETFRQNNLPKPPCYHHIDALINEFKQLRNEEAGPLLKSAGLSLAKDKPHHESALFKYNDNRDNQRETSDEPFRSFLDAVIIADINKEQMCDPVVVNNLEEAQRRMINKPDRSVEEKLGVLKHISYLQLKKFYVDLGLAYMLELGVPSEPYYLALKELMQQLIANKGDMRGRLEYPGEGPYPMGENNAEEYNDEEEEESTPAATLSKDALERKELDKSIAAEEAPAGKKKKGKGKDKGEKVEKGKKKSKSPKEKKKSKEKKGDGTKAKPGKKGKKDKDSKKKPKKDKEDGISEEEEWSAEEEMQNGQPPPETLAPSFYYNIRPEDMTVLGNFWTNMEDRYVRGIRDALNEIRHHHDRVSTFASQFHSSILEFLERPDNKQTLLAQFQEKFNQVSIYIRGDYEVKAELHNRVTELRERLSAICDERHDEALQEVFSILSQGYLEGEIEILTNLFITLIQLEADHYCDVIQFVNDFYCMSGLVKPETLPWCDVLRIELISRSRFASRQFQFGFDGEEDQEEEEDFQVNTISKMLKTSLQPGDRDISSSMRVEPSRVNSRSKKDESPRPKRSEKKVSKKVSRQASLLASAKPTTRTSQPKKLTLENPPVVEIPIESRGESVPEDTNAIPFEKENPDSAPPATRLLEGYFGNDEEDEELKTQKSFRDNVANNHEISVDFLHSILNRVSHNIDKVEAFTMNYIRNTATSSTTPEKETTVPTKEGSRKDNVNVEASEPKARSKGRSKKKGAEGDKKKGKGKSKSKEKSPKSKSSKKTKSESKDSESEGEKKGKNSKSKSKEKGGKGKKGEKKKGKSKKGKKGADDSNGETISTVKLPLVSSTPPQVPQNTPVSKKEKGTKRITEWQQAIDLEGKRIRLQLAVIEEKAKRELMQLKEWLLQIISAGENDAASAYKAEIENVRVVSDVFRFAIENGTPVDTDLTLEKATFLLGCRRDMDSNQLCLGSQEDENDYGKGEEFFDSQSEYFMEEE